MDDLKNALLSTGDRKASTKPVPPTSRDPTKAAVRPKLKGLAAALLSPETSPKTACEPDGISVVPKTHKESSIGGKTDGLPKTKQKRLAKPPLKTKHSADPGKGGITKKRNGKLSKAIVVRQLSPAASSDDSSSLGNDNDSPDDDGRVYDNESASESDDVDSDSDSAEEIRRRVSRRRSRKTKVIPVPEMSNVFRVDTARANQHKLEGPDILRGNVFRPSMAEKVCAMYGTSIWMPDSTVGQQLFEPDRSIQQGKCSIPGMSFSDPRNYQVIQEMLKRHPRSKSDEKGTRSDVMLTVVPFVTREFEQSQMRSPRGQERSCVNGKECVCNRKFGFIMKEFLLPTELAKLQAHSQIDVAVKPCLLCERDTAAYISANIAATSYAPPPDYIVQRYSNLVNIEGEYKFDDCLMTGPGMLYPMVINKANGYESVTSGDGFYLTQSGYNYPDFH